MTSDDRIMQILFSDIDHIDFSNKSGAISLQIVSEVHEALNTARWVMEIAYPENKKEIAELEDICNVLNHPYRESLVLKMEERIKLEKLDRLI